MGHQTLAEVMETSAHLLFILNHLMNLLVCPLFSPPKALL